MLTFCRSYSLKIVSKNAKRNTRRKPRGGAKTVLGGKAAAVNTAATKAARNAAVAGKPAAPPATQAANKIMVSGLPNDVNETQIRVRLFVRFNIDRNSFFRRTYSKALLDH